MRRNARIPNLGGKRAVILHRSHQTVAAISRQLAAIGLEVETCWPELTGDFRSADFIFFDADLGFDAQFPWTPGSAPMPLVALIGSEAPGRVEWALSHRADAQLLKPVGTGGVYSALLIALQGFDARHKLALEVAALRAQVAERETIVLAVLALTSGGTGEAQAYQQLRRLAMGWQVTIEEAARRVVAARDREEASFERPHRA